MRNYIQIILTASTLLFVLQSCESQKIVVNREVETTNDGKMLLGHQLKDQFTKDDVIVVLLHDHGSRYVGKIYNDEWMKEQGWL